MDSKPPTAGLGGERNMSAILGLTVSYANTLEKKDVSHFEKIYISYR